MAKRKKLWSKQIEEAGLSIRLFERTTGGVISLSIVTGRKDGEAQKYVKSTGLRNKSDAEEKARAVARSVAKLIINAEDLQSLTLGQVLQKFFAEKAPSYTERWRKHAETRRNLFIAAWGVDKRVEDIGQSDVDRYASQRRSGALKPPGSRVKAVRDGTIEADLRWLASVFNWAKGVKVNRKRLLASNPLTGLRRPREENPRRPVASHDRYLKTLAKCDEVDPEGRLQCMLALARFTGRREGAICQLRADDVLRGKQDVRAALAALGLDENAADHFPNGGIRWRAETDKVGLDSITPLNGQAREEMDRYLERNPRIGNTPLFPSPKDPAKPFRGDIASKWLVKAEKRAKLPKLAGGIFHPYRRLFAIELRALPVHDVAAVGGWRSVRTVQQIYQRAEPAGVLGAIEQVGS